MPADSSRRDCRMGGAGSMESSTRRGVDLPLHVYPLRAVGLAIGFACVAAVFAEAGAHPAAWAGLAFNAFVWPHLAFLAARRSPDPYRAERRNLVVDSALGGIWLPLMGFNLLPSVLLVSMLSLDKMSVGGPRLLAASWGALAATAACGTAFGVAFRPETSMAVMLACIPLLVLYPLVVSITTFRLRRRIREQGRRLDEMLRTEALSGLATRQHWEESVVREFARTRRTARAASLVLLDLDQFKSINDRFGHLAGDEVIRQLGIAVRGLLRAGDLAGRYGGDEFAILLPETGAHDASTIAERVREAIDSLRVPGLPDLRCTASLGVAEIGAGATQARDWIEQVDRALYRAKELGRNRVNAAP
jgi:diguanylate cyclase